MGEALTFRFAGGGSTYTLADDLGLFSTPVPWSDSGLRFHLNLLETNEVVFYALTIHARGENDGIYRFCGELDIVPFAARFTVLDVEQADVFFNHLYLTGTDLLPMIQIGGITIGAGVNIALNSLAGWLYTLEQRTNMLLGGWQGVPGQSTIPGTGGMLVFTNDVSAGESFYRVQSEQATP